MKKQKGGHGKSTSLRVRGGCCEKQPRLTSSRYVLAPQQDEAQTAGPQLDGDGALVKTSPCEEVPPIRNLIGPIAFNRFRSEGLLKSIPAAIEAASMFTPRYFSDTLVRNGCAVSKVIGSGGGGGGAESNVNAYKCRSIFDFSIFRKIIF